MAVRVVAMSDFELLPCPFCGGKGRMLMPEYPIKADVADAYVQCSDCDVIGPQVMIDNDVHERSDWPEIEAEAISAWNRRHTCSKRAVVKSLEWREMGAGPRCITVCGMYAISPSSKAGRPTLSLTSMPGNMFGKFVTIEEAKSAAQSDYEKRIRSCLCEGLTTPS